MKIQIKNCNKNFQPVELIFTFETQDELNAFTKICDSPVMRETAHELGCELPDSDAMISAGGDASSLPAFVQTIAKKLRMRGHI